MARAEVTNTTDDLGTESRGVELGDDENGDPSEAPYHAMKIATTKLQSSSELKMSSVLIQSSCTIPVSLPQNL